MAQSGLNVALIGASGNVGRKVAELLLEKKILAPNDIKPYASSKSAGKTLSLANHEWVIGNIDEINFGGVDLALFTTPASISSTHIPEALKHGAVAIDSSSHYRMDEHVPLVVVPVNKHLISLERAQLFAMANCIASPLAIVLQPIHTHFKINSVVVSTYQAVSGAGKQAMDELSAETKALANSKSYKRHYFDKQIAFNLIPQIDVYLENGYTNEEIKIMQEVDKLLDAKLHVSATSVRVPVMVGHSASICIEFDKKPDLEQVVTLLKGASFVSVCDDYVTPVEVAGLDAVCVSRIRRDVANPKRLHMWLCSDNLRRGAATDMVEAAAEVITQIKQRG